MLRQWSTNNKKTTSTIPTPPCLLSVGFHILRLTVPSVPNSDYKVSDGVQRTEHKSLCPPTQFRTHHQHLHVPSLGRNSFLPSREPTVGGRRPEVVGGTTSLCLVKGISRGRSPTRAVPQSGPVRQLHVTERPVRNVHNPTLDVVSDSEKDWWGKKGPQSNRTTKLPTGTHEDERKGKQKESTIRGVGGQDAFENTNIETTQTQDCVEISIRCSDSKAYQGGGKGLELDP